MAEAKRQLFGRVGIDIIAGPSEVLIVADDSANPAWVAVDMLSQAEHDPGSAVLVTTSSDLAERTVAAVKRRLPQMTRSTALAKALKEYSAIIVVPDLETACATANAFAPEHLQIVVRDPEKTAERINNAGAVFSRLVHAGAGRGLLCRTQPRSAHRWHGAVLRASVVQRFPEGLQHHPLRSVRPGRGFGRHNRLRYP